MGSLDERGIEGQHGEIFFSPLFLLPRYMDLEEEFEIRVSALESPIRINRIPNYLLGCIPFHLAFEFP